MALSSKSILTPPGVASFINLAKPRPMIGRPEELRYSIVIIFDKVAQAREEFKNLEKEIDAEIKRRWPNKIPPGLRSPFRDGADKAGQYEGYHKGDIFITPWSQMKPGIVNIDRQDILDLGEIFAGWTCRANVRPFAYDQGGNKGCNLLLDSVQFLRPGKRLDGRKAASESFPNDMASDEEMV